jgi:TonB family protein
MKISLLALYMWIGVATQLESFEKQALSAVQQTLVSDLDSKLPRLPFGDWLSNLVGKRTGIVWQLAECGDPVSASYEGEQEAKACVEAVMILPNDDRLILDVLVGTFKSGMVGEPTFLGAVIDNGETLYQVRRLRDLPLALRLPKSVPRNLPDLHREQVLAMHIPFEVYLPSVRLTPDGNGSAPGLINAVDSPPPPPPQSELNQSSAVLVDAISIAETKPVYPTSARSMNISGKVEVRIVISEEGRVIEATSISGPMTLRNAAEYAARQWIYRPATLNGVPIKLETVLTFGFAPEDP